MKWHLWGMTLAVLAIAGCSTVASYDQAAYEHATSLKVDTLTLIDKATGPYSDHTAEITKLSLDLQKAYEYDKGRPLNGSSRAEWEDLMIAKQDDPKSGMLPRFFSLWKKHGSLPQSKVGNVHQNVSDAFDQIIESENGKNRS